jgi:5-(carboxyamino)imidazole ribonucleotide synthase
MLTIGILGGGQLGMMTCHAASRLGFKTVVFCDQENSPAMFSTNQSIVASYSNKDALIKFASMIDVATFEFENISADSVDFLSSLKPVFPSSKALKISQNRILEKTFLNKIGIKTAEFFTIKCIEDLKSNLEKFKKGILKTATMGYDGKGQFILENKGSQGDYFIEKIFKDFSKSELILEKFCNFSKEISVLVARSLDGEIACYEPILNIHKNGILDKSFYPSGVSKNIKNLAKEVAIKIAENLDLIGILTVEFFIIDDENLLVNEFAPRPHNSYHLSIDFAFTSQFEQLVRAIAGLKLGNPNFFCDCEMRNLIGNDVKNLDDFIGEKDAKTYLYGKEIKEGRKMGHINFLH